MDPMFKGPVFNFYCSGWVSSRQCLRGPKAGPPIHRAQNPHRDIWLGQHEEEGKIKDVDNKDEKFLFIVNAWAIF